jgi:hypothetical protein
MLVEINLETRHLADSGPPSFKYTPEEIDGVLAELLAAVYFLVTSPGMLMLESHIEQELRELV